MTSDGENELTSEAWTDLGYSEKRSKKDPILARIPFSPKSLYEHEDSSITDARRLRNIQAVLAEFPEAEMDGSTLIGMKRGKKFTFYTSSDTYFIWSTQKYGSGIQKLLSLIAKHLS